MGIRDEVEQLHAEYAKHFGNQDSAGVATLYTADARYLPPGIPLVEGRDAIRAFIDGVIALGGRSLELKTGHIIEAGDCVIEVGSFVLGIEAPGADPFQVAGKSVAVYGRQSDGSLKLIIDAFNMDAA